MTTIDGISTEQRPKPPILVGRDREERQLRAHLAEAPGGQRRLVLVGGDAGIGKTSLVAATIQEARSIGALIIRGGCDDLSSRELEVLRLVADGMTDAEVADRLWISPRTVGQHLRSIYNKLGVSSRAAATRIAVEQHLI